MKSCNTEKGKPKRKEFRFIKKKPKVAGEFFQIYKPLEPLLFFWYSARSLRKRTLNSPPALRCHTDVLWQRNDTDIKGKAADFFGIFYWPTGSKLFRECPSKQFFCLYLSLPFILSPTYSYNSYFVLKSFLYRVESCTPITLSFSFSTLSHVLGSFVCRYCVQHS